jgi:hypothetical protein
MQGNYSGAERVAQERQGVSFEIGNFPHRLQCIPEQETYSAPRTKEVGEHRERTPLYPGKKECRATSAIYSPLNSSNLQGGVDFTVDAEQLSVTLKVKNTFLKISVAHENVSVSFSTVVRNCSTFRNVPIDFSGVAPYHLSIHDIPAREAFSVALLQKDNRLSETAW